VVGRTVSIYADGGVAATARLADGLVELFAEHELEMTLDEPGASS
jgi:hypothetical protein